MYVLTGSLLSRFPIPKKPGKLSREEEEEEKHLLKEHKHIKIVLPQGLLIVAQLFESFMQDSDLLK